MPLYYSTPFSSPGNFSFIYIIKTDHCRYVCMFGCTHFSPDGLHRLQKIFGKWTPLIHAEDCFFKIFKKISDFFMKFFKYFFGPKIISVCSKWTKNFFFNFWGSCKRSETRICAPASEASHVYANLQHEAGLPEG